MLSQRNSPKGRQPGEEICRHNVTPRREDRQGGKYVITTGLLTGKTDRGRNMSSQWDFSKGRQTGEEICCPNVTPRREDRQGKICRHNRTPQRENRQEKNRSSERDSSKGRQTGENRHDGTPQMEDREANKYVVRTGLFKGKTDKRINMLSQRDSTKGRQTGEKICRHNRTPRKEDRQGKTNRDDAG